VLRLEVLPGARSDLGRFRRIFRRTRRCGRHGVRADGSALLARVHFPAIPDLARARDVLYLQEEHEMMLPTPRSADARGRVLRDSLGVRPFDDAGSTGAGSTPTATADGSTTDGHRAPQIVGVTDNGISVDTPSFSQTATQVSTFVPPAPIGPRTGRCTPSSRSSTAIFRHVTPCSRAPARTATWWRAPSRPTEPARRLRHPGGIGGPGEPRGANLTCRPRRAHHHAGRGRRELVHDQRIGGEGATSNRESVRSDEPADLPEDPAARDCAPV